MLPDPWYEYPDDDKAAKHPAQGVTDPELPDRSHHMNSAGQTTEEKLRKLGLRSVGGIRARTVE